MDLHGLREFQLLTEVEQDAYVTQRSLAIKLGVALGLTNLYLKRLARKGYIKITTIPRHRIAYLLTPLGMAEKTRLTYLYMEHSLMYYREIRQRIRETLAGLSKDGVKRLVIYGAGELAELAYLSINETDLTLVGFVNGKTETMFLGKPLWPMEALRHLEFDAVLIADLENTRKIHARMMRAGVSRAKVVVL
jgi:DNA-binding MarR family transcriptional regulator